MHIWSLLADAVLNATKTSNDLASEVASLQKIVYFLENMDQKEQVANSNVGFVDRLDKICFCFFLFIDIIYIIIVVIVTRTDICKPKIMVIWDKEDYYYYNFWGIYFPEYFNNDTLNYYWESNSPVSISI